MNNLSIQPENCFVVYPEKDDFFHFEIVLADPGSAGHDAITDHYPNLKLALDADELANVEQSARNVPMFTTKPYWFKTPQQFFFIAIQDGIPVSKFLVEATSAGQAIRKAAQAAPGCLFNIVGLLAHFRVAGNAIIAILEGNEAIASLDLRTNAGQ